MLQFKDSKYPFMFLEDTTSSNTTIYGFLEEFINEDIADYAYQSPPDKEDEEIELYFLPTSANIDNDEFIMPELETGEYFKYSAMKRAIDFIQYVVWINSKVNTDEEYVSLGSLISLNDSDLRDHDNCDIFDKFPEPEEETKKNHELFNSFICDKNSISKRYKFPMRNPNPNRHIELRIYESENLGKIPYVYIEYYPSKKNEIFIDLKYFKEV